MFATLRATNASSIGVNPVLALQLWKNIFFRNSTNMKVMRNLITVSENYGSSNIDNSYSHLRRKERDFDWCYWWFNKTFLYPKAKNYKSLIQGKISSYHWNKEYCRLRTLVVYYFGPDGSLQHDTRCSSSDDSNCYTSFLYQVQTMLFYYHIAYKPHMIKS